jgi:hypothetical protein
MKVFAVTSRRLLAYVGTYVEPKDIGDFLGGIDVGAKMEIEVVDITAEELEFLNRV